MFSFCYLLLFATVLVGVLSPFVDGDFAVRTSQRGSVPDRDLRRLNRPRPRKTASSAS